MSFKSSRLLAGLLALVLASVAVAQETRKIETKQGTIELKGQPQRVVTLDEIALDVLLAVGMEPAGTLATRGGTDMAPYLQAHLGKSVPLVGTVREPSLEAILRLRPDLILAPADLPDTLYQKLSRIAPVIQPASSQWSGDWRSNLRLYAAALDKSEQLEAELSALEQDVEQLHAQLDGQSQTVSVVRWNPQGPIAMSSQLFAGQLLTQLGLDSTELARQLMDRPHSDTLSLENLPLVDADWLVLASLNADGKKAMDEAMAQPVFQRLKAVQNGHVKVVDGQVWSSGAGPLAARVLLDDLKHMLGNDSAN